MPSSFAEVGPGGTRFNSDHDRIVEIAIVELLGTKETGTLFHSYVNPDIAIPGAATEIHGITDAMVRSSPTFAEITSKVVEFFSGAHWFVGHHAEFDLGFVNRELQAAGHSTLVQGDRTICTCDGGAVGILRFDGGQSR